MSGHDFKFGREVGFFQRMFGESFTPKEVDELQRREDQRYSDSFGTLEGEFESALNDAAKKEIAPASFNGNFEEFLEFKDDYEKNKGSVILNDKKVTDFPLYGPTWNSLIENSKFKDWDGFAKTKWRSSKLMHQEQINQEKQQNHINFALFIRIFLFLVLFLLLITF